MGRSGKLLALATATPNALPRDDEPGRLAVTGAAAAADDVDAAGAETGASVFFAITAGVGVDVPAGFAVMVAAGLETACFAADVVAAAAALVPAVVGATGAGEVGVLSLSISMLIRLLILW